MKRKRRTRLEIAFDDLTDEFLARATRKKWHRKRDFNDLMERVIAELRRNRTTPNEVAVILADGTIIGGTKEL